jgi:hypothetical protein
MEKSLPNGNGRGVVKSAQPSFAPLGHLPPLLWGKARARNKCLKEKAAKAARFLHCGRNDKVGVFGMVRRIESMCL